MSNFLQAYVASSLLVPNDRHITHARDFEKSIFTALITLSEVHNSHGFSWIIINS